jgi:hypothetical protein
MKAAWYERQGAARDVLVIGEMVEPQPSAGEVRMRVAFSGVNPRDVKKREDAFGLGMAYPRVIPHRDGAGTVDASFMSSGSGIWIRRDMGHSRVWYSRQRRFSLIGEARIGRQSSAPDQTLPRYFARLCLRIQVRRRGQPTRNQNSPVKQ